ncbi:cupin domain-containing protein [Mycolicibacterium sp. 120270]|uniref:cupin domain-containing protein n=1 Tax=Mycolicibacterium sp. 120270 TaxID=3090600 RepID=UPI00299F018B|nr:cupin domain-containing protein [Mycolicibacterium sp. 120270]MDX1886417.1 cupin domain-containing protein [Mycolicibacterium sp. 120270]
MKDNTSTKVVTLEQIDWHETALGRNFWISDDLVGGRYSTRFSAQLTKFGPGGASPLHHHTYNHAFYFLTGTARIQIGDGSWDTEPGSFVKIPAYEEHSVTNTGDGELVFLVIYDPPHTATD